MDWCLSFSLLLHFWAFLIPHTYDFHDHDLPPAICSLVYEYALTFAPTARELRNGNSQMYKNIQSVRKIMASSLLKLPIVRFACDEGDRNEMKKLQNK